MTDDVQGALRDMARAIGGLESTVKTLTVTWQQQEQSASNGRRDLHQKVDQLRSDVSAKVDGMRTDMTAMGAQLATAIKDIAEMKPVVEAVETVKVQATGVRNFTRWLWGVWAAVGGGVMWVVSSFVEIHPKH